MGTAAAETAMDERQAWLEERRKGIGGSDSPVILGISPFKSRLDLWHEKRGETTDGPPTPAMQRGTHLEPLIAQVYSKKTGRKLRNVNQILRHKDHDWMIANIDRHIVADNGDGPGILEIKSPGLSVFAKCKREGLPDYYTIQLQHYLEVKGWSWGSFAVFNAERWELLWFDVKRDPELVSIIIEKDSAFWGKVLSGEMPDQDSKPDIVLPPSGPSELVTMDSPAWKDAVDRLREAKEIKAEAESYEETVKEEIITLMGDAQVAEGSGARIYNRLTPGRKTLDTKALKKAHPEIDYSKFEKSGNPYQSFRPYFLKEANNYE